jgi:hypothetical protein
MTELKSLNLSFNRITKVEGIQNLLQLQILELGKNYKLQGDQTRVEEILGKILSFAATNPVGIQARSELGS